MFPLSDAEIISLAPASLPSLRKTRYAGDGVSVPLAAFTPDSAATIRRLYAALQTIHEALSSPDTPLDQHLAAVHRIVDELRWSDLLAQLRAIAAAGAHETPQVSQAIHDLRGGAFQALSMHLQMARLNALLPEEVARMFLLARDHLKIMRNCVPDLDPIRYARDMVARAHSIDLLVEKWGETIYPLPGVQARVAMDCRYHGAVSDRCVEFAALDRVLYNLLNNATRHTSDGRVEAVVLPLPGEAPPNLRFVIANSAADSQRETLRRRFGSNLGRLFEGGFTTGGNGIGMQICGELVANAFGLHTAAEALDGGYVGAALADPYFIAWFHWPALAD